MSDEKTKQAQGPFERHAARTKGYAKHHGSATVEQGGARDEELRAGLFRAIDRHQIALAKAVTLLRVVIEIHDASIDPNVPPLTTRQLIALTAPVLTKVMSDHTPPRTLAQLVISTANADRHQGYTAPTDAEWRAIVDAAHDAVRGPTL